MDDRIEGVISHKDYLVIRTALIKIALETVRLTSAEVTAKMAESRIPVNFRLEMTSPGHDKWFERYGHEEY